MAEQPPITAPVSRRTIYTLIMFAVSGILAAAFSIGYSAQAVHSAKVANAKAITLAQQTNLHNLQQICGIITILDDAYQNPATPPTTPLGRQLGDAIHSYRQFLGCNSLK